MRGCASDILTPLVILLAVASTAACTAKRMNAGDAGSPHRELAYLREQPFVRRPFVPFSGKSWIGNAIAYGPFRDGQYPGGPSPTKAELRQDLHLMSQHWRLLRMYGAVGSAKTVLEIIEEDDLDMKIMIGIWIGVEERLDPSGKRVEDFAETRTENRREVESAIRLAADYPDIVIAVSVGNETQVSWSSHRIAPELLIGYVREVRARAQIPITVADDFNFWNKPESEMVTRELDFIVTHAHPLWNGLQLEDALEWTRGALEEVQATHPNHTIVLGETGWATRKHNQGEQTTLIKGQPGEEQQKIFFDALTAWVNRERITTFFFEAFDENWKGGEHADDVEKHWGLFRADRTPKKALAEGE
ncbi:MAG: glycosyl hydrolase family 17 protein [Candidatus Krumholzibacteria bacterium]|nr:glycosyl hydrolase family 17 protein [Candidatus Krumholzibacteria bacterium]